jgi:aconitase A
LLIHRKDGRRDTVKLTLRVETEQELEYLKCGGILPYVFDKLRRKQNMPMAPA